MPRGKSKKSETAPVVTMKTYKRRSSTAEERMAALDAKIEALTKLVAQREALLRSTEEIVEKRKGMLETNRKQLAAAQARKDKLSSPKITPKATRAAEKAKLDEFLARLSASGKSLDDIIDALK